jgi:FtsP/CotA-like multicopper oxidase with cupredoxin domain
LYKRILPLFLVLILTLLSIFPLGIEQSHAQNPQGTTVPGSGTTTSTGSGTINTKVSGSNQQDMPPMRQITNEQRKAAANRAEAARAALINSGTIKPQAVPGPGSTPDYFGIYPNYANSPVAQQNLPAVTIGAPSAGGTQATADPIVSNGLTGIIVTGNGRNYFSAPTVTISGGGGAGATATAAISGNLTSITISNPGSGYTSPPPVYITGGSGTGATASTSLNGTAVGGITIISQGSGYTSAPAISIGLPGSGGTQALASSTINGFVSGITLTSAGNGYTTAPTITLTGGGGTEAAASALLGVSGAITGFNITNGGSRYLTNPSVNLTGGSGTGATASAVVTGGVVTAINVNTGGSGYGLLAKETSTAVVGIQVTNPGSGYTSAPTVTLTANSSGSGATARAWIAFGKITGITIINGGTGYTTVPTVTINGGNGTGGAGTAIIAYNKTIGIRKFVDSLPGLTAANANDLGQYIPVAVADTTTYPGSDYYEIALVRYTEQLHRDLPPSDLEGYMQTNTADATVKKPSYLGPMIVANENRPVRIKFTNLLPNGTDGNLFIPVDTTVMGSGMGPDSVNSFTQNRATLHLHGGLTPWISDGTPDQWTTPANETTPWPTGVEVQYVPDMWYDPVTHVTVPAGTAGATNNPGAGSLTFYYTNQQSARLMFYHDHSYGVTRVNIYAGEAAGYLIQDTAEQSLVTSGVIPNTQIPLIIQDKTFVPGPAQLAAEDPTWDTAKWGSMGNLWYPHVYMPNQNPVDAAGSNAMGRWDYGPWFWPPFTGLVNGEKPNPYYVAGTSEGPTIPGVPNISLTPEAFMDTPIVNGTAYPFLNVQPKAYRFRILNASNDRTLNLSLFYAASNGQMWDVSGNLTNPNAGEVPMVAAVSGDPGTFGYAAPDQVDGRVGGVPDSRAAGPNFIQIGSEGGFLPKPAVIPNGPVGYEYGRRSVTVLNISNHSLILGPAERADVIVDFSQVPSGSNLILYNDAPAPVPAFDSRIDYFTGDPDQTDIGGAPTTLPGYGPNTRTIMQLQVTGTPASAYNVAALNTALPAAFAASQPKPIIPQAAYNAAYNGNFAADPYVRIQDNSVNIFNTLLSNGSLSSIRIINGGKGYVSNPTVTISPPTTGTRATATAIVGGVVGVTLTNSGTGYATAPTITFSAPTAPGGVRATASAVLSAGILTSITITNPGSLYTSTPTVAISGGGGSGALATASVLPGVVTSITLANPGTGYTSIPTVTITDPPAGTGNMQAVASALGVDMSLQPKAIQELFETGYGRMNAILGVELPNTSATIQTTIPYGYLDPATELLVATDQAAVLGSAADGTQIWKITHNGVDTHFIHFHLVNVQVINRVGWDGVVKPPDDNELGWKETVRMNPLEDCIVAMRPVAPVVPFKMPNAIRALDVTAPLNSSGQFFGVDPNNNPVTVTNSLVNYGYEYIWHCHMLGHEENDMMRPIALVVPPDVPTGLTGVRSGSTSSIRLTWTDNAANETGYMIERDTNPAFTNPTWFNSPTSTPASAYGVSLSFTDTAVNTTSTYYYRILATNIVGYGNGYPQITANSAYSATLTSGPPPAAPANFRAVPLSATQVNLTWNAVVGVTGYVIQRATNSGFTTGLTTINLAANTVAYADTSAVGNTAYYYRINAVNAPGTSVMTNATPFPVTTPATLAVPSAPSGLTATRPNINSRQINLSWTNTATNATGIMLQRATDNTFTSGLVSFRLSAVSRFYVDTTAVSGTHYYYRVYAFNAAGNSPYAAIVGPLLVVSPAIDISPLAVPATPGAFEIVESTANQVNMEWTNTASDATGIILQRALDSSFTSGLVSFSLDAISTFYVDTTTSGSTTYYYRVFAANSNGNSPVCNAEPFPYTTPAGGVIPASPTGLTDIVAAYNQVNLTWNDNASNEVGYRLERASDNLFQNNWTSFNLAAQSTFYVDTSISGNTTYYYRVIAFNDQGDSSPSNTAGVNTPPLSAPAAPSDLTAVPVGLTQFTLNWTNNDGNTTGFYLDRATDGAFSVGLTTFNVSGNLTSYDDTSVAVNTNYYYRISAYDSAGTSQPSVTVNALILLAPAAPTLVSVTGVNYREIDLQWQANSSVATGYYITRALDASFIQGLNSDTVSENITTYRDFNVGAGTTYYYKIIAFNSAGQSSPSNILSAATPNQPISSGGGGGGGSGVNVGAVPGQGSLLGISGLQSNTNLILDSTGQIKNDALISSLTGDCSFNITGGTRMLDKDNKPLTQFTAAKVDNLPPSTNMIIVVGYEFGPNGATFSPAINLTLKFDPKLLPPGVKPENLKTAMFDGSQWVTLDSQVDLASNSVSAQVPHFSSYALVAEKPLSTSASAPTTNASPLPTNQPAKPAAATSAAPLATVPSNSTPSVPDKVTVTLPAATVPTQASVQEVTPTINWGLIIGIMAVLTILGVSLYFVIVRRRAN